MRHLIITFILLVLVTPAGSQEGPGRLVLPIGHTGKVNAVAFSPDGRYILTGSSDKTAKLWDVATGREIRTFKGHTGGLKSVNFSPDGQHVLTSSGTAKLWEIDTGREVQSFAPPGEADKGVWAMFMPDGRSLLTVTWMWGTVILWDANTGSEIRTFEGPRSVYQVALSPDGWYILMGTINDYRGKVDGIRRDIYFGELKLFDVATGRVIRTMKAEGAADNSPTSYIPVAFSPDGQYALNGSYDGTVTLWDVETGRKIRTLKDMADTGYARSWLISVAFSSDGRYCLMSSQGRSSVTVWEVQTGRRIRTIEAGRNVERGHQDRLTSAAFSPDGKYVLTGSWDTTAKLWQIATGRLVRTFP